MPIHPTAIIAPQAQIDPSAIIDPYVVIDGPVKIGPDVHIYPQAYISGWTEIGAKCQIHPFAVVGHAPQDTSYDGSETYCRIGQGTVIREGVSIHRGTPPGSATEVGANCYIMANAHIAHNCKVGDNVIMANSVLLAGHVTIGDKTFMGGDSAAHQFTRVGKMTMIAGKARLYMDVPHYMMTNHDGHIVGLNVVGLRRSGFTADERKQIKEAYKILYRDTRDFSQAIKNLAASELTELTQPLLDFVQAPSKRGIAKAPIK
ncbi:MAG: acyl-ACP--UDP-N-acetylglucosamine O-acyltransferase [Phycisphaerae bacterium]|nr:acyl-ACP--UDP-N-acetylglucosamine O-acyltransferase [Phycisphaerae bacterium]